MLLGDLLKYGKGLAGTGSVGGLSADRGRIVHVEPLDRTRPCREMRGTQSIDRDHRASRTLHEEEVQIVGVGAVRGVGLDVDTVYSVVHVEVVDIDRTGERFQGREDIGHRQPQKLDLVTIRIEIQLRDVLLHSGGQSGELFPLLRIMKKRVRGVLEILIGRVPPCLKHHRESARSTESRDNGRCADVHLALRIA